VLEVTADTNIYISGLIFTGPPRQFLMQAEAGRFRLAISDALLEELRRILRAKFAWSDEAVAETVANLLGCAVLVQPTERLDVVRDDPDDNRVLECAVAAGSRYIVTGDAALLRLGSYANIRILKVAEFFGLIREPSV
jgi:putative PIN family toxin of toxin-antitoxin system